MKIILMHTDPNYLVGMRLPLLTQLVSLGHEVQAMAPGLDARHASILRGQGIRAAAYSLDANGLNPLRDLLDFGRMFVTLKKERPDVVILNNAKVVALGSLASLFAGIKSRFALVGGLGYAFTNDGANPSIKKRIVKAVLTFLYAVGFRVCRRVIFQNPDDLNEMVGTGICPERKASVVNGSGVPTDKFVPADHFPDLPVFLMVSRLVGEKGVREFIDAAYVVKQTWPEARFIIAGGPSNNPSALSTGEIEAIKKAGVVELLGQVEDVAGLLRQATTFVLPSYREGVPRSTLEAMATGLPIITTDAPGCRETVIDGHNGFLIPVRDVRSLSDKMLQLAADPVQRERMGRNSRVLAVKRFEISVVNMSMLSVMDLVE